MLIFVGRWAESPSDIGEYMIVLIRLKSLLAAVSLLLVSVISCGAQKVSFSTNAVEWANLGTVNAEAGVSAGRHVSFHAGFRYNPWTFRAGDPLERYDDPLGEDEAQFQNRKQAYDLSVRWWPWYAYSGWWLSLKGQYMEYDRGGFITHPREAGDAFGGGFSFGYSYLLAKHLNLDFGLGLWGGYVKYGKYRCTNCGQKVEEGDRYFVLPDDVKLSLVMVF